MSSSETTLVVPSLGLLLWSIWVLLAISCAVIAASKERWGYFWAGFITAGVAWVVGSCLIANPRSLWARHFYGPAKQERAVLAWLRGGVPSV
ncbi:MAG: hypothetical protein WAP35_01965 [Solirubrobacterales bacterium]